MPRPIRALRAKPEPLAFVPGCRAGMLVGAERFPDRRSVGRGAQPGVALYVRGAEPSLADHPKGAILLQQHLPRRVKPTRQLAFPGQQLFRPSHVDLVIGILAIES